MSSATEKTVSGWTLDTLAVHLADLRLADKRFEDERDRRYAEVKAAEERALRVKEQADRDALSLAREIQTYKDEKANELREQINSERGLYATKGDLEAAIKEVVAQMKPLVDYVAVAQGRGSGFASSGSIVIGLTGAIGVIVGAAAVIERLLHP